MDSHPALAQAGTHERYIISPVFGEDVTAVTGKEGRTDGAESIKHPLLSLEPEPRSGSSTASTDVIPMSQLAPSSNEEGLTSLIKKITLLKRAVHQGDGDSTRRSASHGEGMEILTTSFGSMLGNVEYRQTGSEPSLTRRPPSPSTSPPDSPFDTAPSFAIDGSDIASVKDVMMTEQQEVEEGGVPALDPLVITAMSTPRDRALLLRAELEMERFLSNSTMSRLPLSPPYFPPQLNSYQRLLIHRLADTYGIRREVEAAPVNWAHPSSSTATGVVVLVKGIGARMPPLSLSTLAPLPAPTLAIVSITPISSTPLMFSPAPIATSNSSIISPQLLSGSSSPLLSLSDSPSAVFKILPRVSSQRSASTASSATGVEDDPSMRRRDMTLEEREAAYKEARERIFSGSEDEVVEAVAVSSAPPKTVRSVSADSTYSRASFAPPSALSPSPSLYSNFPPSSSHPQYSPSPVYYTEPSMGVGGRVNNMGPGGGGAVHLRPSAPSFNPNQAGWSSYSYATTSYQNGNLVAQESVYGENHSQYGGRHTYSSTTEGTTYSTHPPPPDRSNNEYQRHPPIQITAPSPLPQHAHQLQQLSYHHLPPSPQPFSGHSQPIPPPPAPASSTVWSQMSLSSPSLSTSSGGSSYRQSAHSIGPNSKSGDGVASGYIMRYPDGAVIYPGGERKGGPSTRTPARSVSSVSTTSSSTSRTASSSNLRAYATSSHAGSRSPGTGEETQRRINHSNSASLSSSSPAVSSRGPLSSSSMSGSIGRPTRSRSIGTATSNSGSSDSIAGSASGIGSASTNGEEARQDDQGVPDRRNTRATGLHPSLPAKPTWASSGPMKSPINPTAVDHRNVTGRAHSTSPASTYRVPINAPRNYPTSASSSPAPYSSRSSIPSPLYTLPYQHHHLQYHQPPFQQTVQRDPSAPQYWDPSSQPLHNVDPYISYPNYLTSSQSSVTGGADRRTDRSMELFDPKSVGRG